jgi:hypothetical protein
MRAKSTFVGLMALCSLATHLHAQTVPSESKNLPAPAEIFTLRQSDPDTGSHIKRNVAVNGKIPFDKRYEDLTAQQKAIVRSYYDKLPEDDEPPFPTNGLGPVFRKIVALQRDFQLDGELSLDIDINKECKAMAIKFYKTPSAEASQEIANILLREPYKPGKCAGAPCKMAFPIEVRFGKSL